MLFLNASGCLDALTAPDVARSLDAFVTKTVTPEPREGNAPVRIAETEFGMLNAIGLANPGRDTFLRQTLPRLASELDIPIWVSVGGFNARDYAETCEQLARDEVACIELNLSCPNVDEAPESAAEIVRACREATAKPLYAKVSPHSWDMGETVRAIEAAGADGLSMINTLRGTTLDARLRPTLSRGTGGYSGPALRPVALAAVLAARTRDAVADRRHGRRRDRTTRDRADCVRRDARRARHRPVRGSRCTDARARRARRGTQGRSEPTRSPISPASRSTLLPARQTPQNVERCTLHAANRLVGCCAHGAAADTGTSSRSLTRSADGSAQESE